MLPLLGLPQRARAAEVVDRLGQPGPLGFNGTSYRLAWSSHPSPHYYKQEYLPAGQTLEAYRSMLILEVLDSGTGVDGALGTQVRMLNQRKGSDPLVNFSALRNPRTGEALLDFVLGGRTAAGGQIVEWNAYRYVPRKSAGGGDGILLFAVSHRAYGGEVADFLRNLKGFRPAEIDRVAKHALPAVRIAG